MALLYILVSIAILTSVICLVSVVKFKRTAIGNLKTYIDDNKDEFRGQPGKEGPRGLKGNKGDKGDRGDVTELTIDLTEDGYLIVNGKKYDVCLKGKNGIVTINTGDGELTKEMILSKLNEFDTIEFTNKVRSTKGFYEGPSKLSKKSN